MGPDLGLLFVRSLKTMSDESDIVGIMHSIRNTLLRLRFTFVLRGPLFEEKQVVN